MQNEGEHVTPRTHQAASQMEKGVGAKMKRRMYHQAMENIAHVRRPAGCSSRRCGCVRKANTCSMQSLPGREDMQK